MLDHLFYYQLAGVVGAGSFIGEFYRSSSATISMRVFIGNFLAGAFLSYLIAYSIYITTNGRQTAIVTGGLLAFQDKDQLVGIAKNVLSEILKKGDRNNE